MDVVNAALCQPLLSAVHGTKDPYMVLAYYLCCTHTCVHAGRYMWV
ncbi:hypothetical protein ALC62_09676 [Cyphomyrmex costatus]|uniref:Uncharacterized protein n=1 Tax=Cyphomyrmex costatus TaxID=456900 RepID=A0A151IFP0_9HYME|nr:hypothetical protein ALC62_09676 [Cyphomyrmex costatus]